MKTYLQIGVVILLFQACQNPTTSTPVGTDARPQLGSVSLDVNGSEAAQPLFEDGLLYLHSFEYFDSKNAFIAAQKIDSSFGMAYWGELMSYNHSLWHRQLYKEAQQTLVRMGKTPALRQEKLKSELEKDLFKGMEILYGQGDKLQRDKAYSNHMAGLYKKYPSNHEVATFYAVSLLGLATSTRDAQLYDKSAGILRKVLDQNPQHPGALHYFIHSRDYPTHAHLAIDAAESYSKVAPDAAHALHMPSHIFIALGRWNDVVNANIDSWNASVNKNTDHPMMPTSYHALAWLHYGLLQRGEYAMAETLLQKMYDYCQAKATQEARSYLLAMKGAHIVETNNWEGPIANIAIQVEDLNISKKAGFFYLEAMKGFYHKRPDYIGSVLKKVKDDKYLASLNLGKDRVQMCNAAGSGNRPATQKDIDMVTIMEMQMEARLAKLKGDEQKYLSIIKSAAALEEDISYDFGPPVIYKPINEEYAEALIEIKDYKSALEQYDKALTKHPRRLLSLRGKQKVAELIGNKAMAKALSEDIANSLAAKERRAIL